MSFIRSTVTDPVGAWNVSVRPIGPVVTYLIYLMQHVVRLLYLCPSG